MKAQNRLTIYIAVAIVLAILVALVLPVLVGIGGANEELAKSRASWILTPLHLGGDVFLRVLKMLVVPLVVTSVMGGVLGLGDVRQLGRPGLATLVYYLTTTVLAVLLGIILVNLIAPGKGEQGQAMRAEAQAADDKEQSDEEEPNLGSVLENLVLMLFTDNLFRAAANMELLPLIVFSIVFAALLTTLGARVEAIRTLVLQLNEALMALVLLVMKVAPLGIFCLVAARFGEANITGELKDELRKTGTYSLTVLIGLAIHALIVLPALLYYFTRRNPYRFMVQMSQALLTAFSTASSSATLPVSIESAIENAGVNRKSADFVLPLGATVNMDGTALYEAVAAIFIAQVLGFDLGLRDQLIIAVTATLAAIGAAGIPEAGLVTMVIVLTSVKLPASSIGLILSVDWLLDRFRTTVNVFGDAVGAAVVEKTFPPDPIAGHAPSEAAGSLVEPLRQD